MKNLIKFMMEAGILKERKRSGWIWDRVSDPESIAEHTYRTALLCSILGRERGLNLEKILNMALIHDLAESQTGDILVDWKVDMYRNDEIGPGKEHGITEKEKFEKEREALEKLVNLIGEDFDYIKDLWLEFEREATDEAKFVRAIDKLEMALQALEYELSGRTEKKLDKYFKDARNRIKDPELLKILDKIESMRPSAER